MGTVLSTIFITAPLTFIAGWLICKALFEKMLLTSPRTNSPSIKSPEPETPKQEATAELNAAPAELQLMLRELAQARSEKKVLANELVVMKEAVAERDHRLQELKLRLAEVSMPPEETAVDVDTITNIKISKEIRALQNRIDEQKREIAELRHENISVEKRLEGAARRFSLWRERFKPLTKRIRQQHLIMNELREELRLRDQADSAPQSQPVTEMAAESPPPVETPPTTDNLRSIRGIGPAMERKLQDQGIYSLRQLAELKNEELLDLARKLGVSKKQLQKNSWARQAREILELPVNDSSYEAPELRPEAVNA
ncbi:MAG: helix-hairpin-helix domain-containing protein [Gammaproteobacteria bacterium]